MKVLDKIYLLSESLKEFESSIIKMFKGKNEKSNRKNKT